MEGTWSSFESYYGQIVHRLELRDNDRYMGEVSYEGCHIRVLYVDILYRRKGIGSSLLSLVEKRMKCQGCKRVTVEPNSFGPSEIPKHELITFYQRNGYQHLRRKLAFWETLLLMSAGTGDMYKDL